MARVRGIGVAVITSISFDHTRQLGNTLAAIAGEKGGIIKPGIPVVTGVAEAEPLEVIERLAAEAQAPLLRIGRDFDYAFTPRIDGTAQDKLPRGRMDYRGRIGSRGSSTSDCRISSVSVPPSRSDGGWVASKVCVWRTSTFSG